MVGRVGGCPEAGGCLPKGPRVMPFHITKSALPSSLRTTFAPALPKLQAFRQG